MATDKIRGKQSGDKNEQDERDDPQPRHIIAWRHQSSGGIAENTVQTDEQGFQNQDGPPEGNHDQQTGEKITFE